MSNTDDLYFGEPDEEPEYTEPEATEPDPAIIAKLDQEEAAFAAEKDTWLRMYGFNHDCTCGQDYAAGKVTEVTMCMVRMTNDALRRCAEATMEIHALSHMLSKMVDINNDLITLMEELGHTDELQKYFSQVDEDTLQEETETVDLDSEFEQMLLLDDPEDEDADDGLTV